jgi:hypothetical protein
VLAAFLLTLGLFWLSPPQQQSRIESEFLDATLAEYLFDHQSLVRAPADEPAPLSVRVTTPRDTSEFSVLVSHCLDSSATRQEYEMPRASGSLDLHMVMLPAQAKGQSCFYHLELRSAGGELLARLPEEAGREVRLAFVGQVPVWLRVVRIGSLFLGTMFAWLSLFNALALRRPQVRLPRLAHRVVVTTILLPIGGIIAGAAVKYAALGYFWDGWPLGDNVEQTTWLVACLYWIGLTLIMWRNIFALRTGKRKVVADVVTLSVVAGFVLVLFAYFTGA